MCFEIQKRLKSMHYRRKKEKQFLWEMEYIVTG